MLRVSDLLDVLDEMAAFSLAETWDNVGLMVGDPGAEVARHPCLPGRLHAGAAGGC